MKEKYPNYNRGDIIEIDKSLSPRNRELLNTFLKKSSITAGERKVEKIKRLLLQFYDVTEKGFYEQDKESIDSFLVVLNKSNRSVWTKNEIKCYLRQFLKWYYKDQNLLENIKSDNRNQLNPQKITENNLITESDVEKMLRYAESYKERSYLLLAFQTGARPQELAENLRWKDIKFQEKYADITLLSNKTRQSRTFPVVEETMKALWEWKQHYPFPDVKPQDYVFPSRWRDRPMTSTGLNKMLRRMAKASGLNKDVWNYLFRHSRATRLYEELPTPIVEKLMGHKNMAGIYAHISTKKAREAMLTKIYNVDHFMTEESNQLKKEIENLRVKNRDHSQKIQGIMRENDMNVNLIKRLNSILQLLLKASVSDDKMKQRIKKELIKALPKTAPNDSIRNDYSP